MGAEQYRKRPLPVWSIQLGADNAEEVADWCGGELDGESVLVPTMRGQLAAHISDWVMRGTHREYYPIGLAVHAEVCMTDAELLERIKCGLEGLPLTQNDLSLVASHIFAEITAHPDGAQ